MPGLVADSRQRKPILDELERILQSPQFRTSRRSQQFLRYVVEQTLDGHDDRLKERAIGMALFDRPPDYDTGEDAAVRVAANEVRKRLAQHYVSAAPAEVRIELPPGGYHAEFVWMTPPEEQGSHGAPPESPKRLWLPAAALALLAAAAAFLVFRPGPLRGETPFEQFWGPLLETRRPVLICLAHPRVYLLPDPLPEKPKAENRFAPPGDLLAELNRMGMIES